MRNLFFVLIGGLIITSCSKPEVSFNANVGDTSKPPVQVAFENNTMNADSYIWYFGDGTTSEEENPTHAYNKFGDISVILEARKGKSVVRDTQTISVPEPPRPKVQIETNLGTMVVELYNSTPFHRDNFLKLAKGGFYNNLLFHRVINGFMIQGGDPLSIDAGPDTPLGMGGPGYTLLPEIGEPHYKGTLAAARKGDQLNPNRESSGSQFYIVHGKTYSSIELGNIGSQLGMTFTPEQIENYGNIGGAPFLDNQYTVFGRVIEGMDVIDSIAQVETSGVDRPIENIRMQVSVIEE